MVFCSVFILGTYFSKNIKRPYGLFLFFFLFLSFFRFLSPSQDFCLYSQRAFLSLPSLFFFQESWVFLWEPRHGAPTTHALQVLATNALHVERVVPPRQNAPRRQQGITRLTSNSTRLSQSSLTCLGSPNFQYLVGQVKLLALLAQADLSQLQPPMA